MILALLTTAVIVWSLGFSFPSGRRRDGMINEHRYNNRYSDATAARQDHLG
jgi:hypothetical protein